MEGNQVGNRLVPGVDIGATFGNPSAERIEDTSGRLAVEKARKEQLKRAQQLQAARAKRNEIPSATAGALTWDTMPAEDTDNPNPIPDEGLVWPRHLIEEIARARRPKNVQLRLTRFFFFIGCLGALAASIGALIIIAVFQDLEWVRTVYAPTSSKIAIGIFVLLDLLLIPQLLKTLKNLRETTNNPFTNVQPFSAKVRHRTLVYAFGLLALNFVVWLAILLNMPSHVFAILAGVVIILTPFFSLCVQKDVLPSHLEYKPLQILYIVGMALSGLQILLNFFAFYEEPPAPIDYEAIERMAAAQSAARLSGVPQILSNLVFAVCENQPYSIVYMSTSDPNSGLFECNNSHDVYSVAGPVETSESVITGRAFYFGTTSNSLISRYFPAFTGTKYLFRDFRPADETAEQALPSELVLLLPGNSDEEIVTNNLSSIANLLREHDGSELRFSLFYTAATETVLTTRDFILIAAANTITLNDWLPHGDTYESIIDGQPGTYKFEIDTDLSALLDLGADPTLYSAQTRDAIKSRRHISTIFSGIPTSDALRAQLLEGFVDP